MGAPETPAPAGPPPGVAPEPPPQPAQPLPDEAGPPASAPNEPRLIPLLRGTASWYGQPFTGRRTASGEVYDEFGLTAAHPLLPLGTRIEVENLSNGRKVAVRVNDRGPYAKGRILDLSRLAARELDMERNGTAPVRIKVLRWPAGAALQAGLVAYRQSVVQVAAYPNLETARELRTSLRARWPELPWNLGLAANGFHSVWAGPFDEQAPAQQWAQRLERAGYQPLVRRYRN